MRARFTAAPGISLIAIALPGSRARGIEIDNPSGAWLSIPTLETFIPPYVLGWSLAIPYGVISLDVLSSVSPAGQVSTRQGDAITVYLSDAEVANSPGSPDPGAGFIDQFTPLANPSVGMTVTYGVANSASFASNLTGGTKRLRIHAVYLNVGLGAGVPLRRLRTEVFGHFTSTTAPDSRLRIAGSKMHDERIYVPYIDLPTGEEFSLNISSPIGFLDAAFSPDATIIAGMDILLEVI